MTTKVPRRYPRVEEVPDDITNDPVSAYNPQYLHRESYAANRKAGKGQWRCPTSFEAHWKAQGTTDDPLFAPFPSLDDWDLSRWLVRSGLSQGKINEFLHLKTVREKINPPFATSRSFFKHIDALPQGPA
ncbi:hypothetical protein HMN09_00483600 [Mycena chlorophos]|uniref:Uncharacterized protein n=1 Tax=Mycena chlorophos TaxID=658473 RepID=A0A8H6THU0_MYCCL|nr:hypothetical protein HMN09_00483600 [Mycena chlorophos]